LRSKQFTQSAPLVKSRLQINQKIHYTLLVNNQLDAQIFFSCMFTPILYMFRAPMCSSSGE